MKHPALAVAAVASLLVVVGAVWLRAAAPTIGTTAALPAYILVNTPTSVLVTAQIADPSLIAGGVNLLKLDAGGKTLATVGVMHDDGLGGDTGRNDKVFSFRLSINETRIGPTYYQVSAAFKGVLKRALSAPIVVTVDPFVLPPDPGTLGKQTLSGIDTDHDGVRDDVQRYLVLTLRLSPGSQSMSAGRQYVIATQSMVVATEPDQALAAGTALLAGTRCMASRFGVTHAYELVDSLLKLVLNTPDRERSYFAAQRLATSGQMFDAPRFSDLARFCSP